MKKLTLLFFTMFAAQGCSLFFLPNCGDGIIQDRQGEACDNGEDVLGDDCSAECQLVSVCGDGVLQAGEGCDDGNSTNDDACSNVCQLPACGDNIKQTNEGCDDGNTDSGDGCRDNCTEEICGDGIEDPQEQCDDQNNADDDGCSSVCVDEFCGDGVENANGPSGILDECDDGNNANNDGCSAVCKQEVCGDLVVQSNEACDDGNLSDNDGCSGACAIEFCGDAVPQSNEECDEADQLEGDGCDTNCTISRCGNGIAAATEECDDGNNSGGDGCDAVCVKERCGDGVAQPGELCFPGLAPEVAPNPVGIASADFNGDGFADLVTASLGGEVSVLLGDGAGNFVPGLSVDGFGTLSFVDAVDLDADSRVDFVIADQGGPELRVFFNTSTNATLSFDGTTAFSVNSTPVFIANGTFDNDGLPDLVVASGGDKLQIFLNQGGSTFSAPQELVVSPNVSSIAVGDINRDDELDLVSVGAPNGFVQINLGVGNGNFITDAPAQPITGLQATSSVALQHVNSDGNLDILLADAAGVPGVRLFLASSTNVYPATPTASFPTGASPRHIVQGNFGGDAQLDFATTNFEDNSLTVYRHEGTSFVLQQSIPAGTTPLFASVNDFNEDGVDDLSVAFSSTAPNSLAAIDDGAIGVYLRLANPANLASPTETSFPNLLQLAVGSLNGDFFTDLLVVSPNGSGSTLSLLPGAANGAFLGASLLFTNGAEAINDIALGDFSADGKFDIALVTTNKLRLFNQGTSGTFNELNFQNIPGARAAVIANFDNVATKDLAVIAGSDIRTFQQTAIDTFAASTTINLPGKTLIDVVAVDFDADGSEDLVTLNSGLNSLSFFKRTGNFTFAAEVSETLSFVPSQLVSANLNQDNKPDFVVLSQDGTQFALVLQGAAGFSVLEFSTSGEASSLAAADLNGDGAPEVIMTERNTSRVQVLVNKNDNSGALSGPISFVAGANPSGLVVSDFTNDGLLDIVVANQNDDTLYLLPFLK